MADDKQILGMPELQATLKDAVRKLPDEMQKASQQIAKEWIAAARNKAPGRARKAAGGFSIRNDSQGAIIVNNEPTFFGEEFGGQSRASTMMFPPYQGQRGYWFYPAARENADKWQKIWDAAVDESMKTWDHKE